MGETGVPSSAGAQKPCRKLVQQKLSRYWALPDPQSRPTSTFRFLDLPLPIRQNIYRLALDFEPGQFTSLNHVPPSAVHTVNWMLNHPNELSPPEDSQELEDETYEDFSPDPWPFEPISSLFLVCRTIRDEIRAVIFSEGVIAVSSLRYGGLRILEEVGPVAWRALRTLVVDIRSCHCLSEMCVADGWPAGGVFTRDEDEELFFGNGPREGRSHSKRLDTVIRKDRETLSQWQRICEAIAAHTQPDRLELFLVCDAWDLEMAHRIVQPLFSWPQLRNVAISFGVRSPQTLGKLLEFAKDTVLQLLDRPGDLAPFRFLELPTELQTKILEYTLLADAQVIRMNLDGPISICTSPSRRNCCKIQYFGNGEGELVYPDAMKWPRGDRTRAVFCKNQSIAFSMACKDKFLPSAWFGASRQFREVAQDVFYSDAKFEAYGWKETWLAPSEPSFNADEDRCAPQCFLEFLRGLGIDALRRMRKLRLVFPPMEPSYLYPGRRSWGMWLETLDMLQTKVDLSRLELTVIVAKHTWIPDRHRSIRRGQYVEFIERQEPGILRQYKQIFEPVKRLAGLKDLFVHLAWPFREGTEGFRWANERMIEQSVMGESYDSMSRGKPPKTFWSQPGYIDWYS